MRQNVLLGTTVLTGVTRRANWQALRQRLGACIVATLLMAAFLGVWQFLVPGSDTEPSEVNGAFWVFVFALWISFPNAVVLASSASRVLWRERRRAAAFVPAPGLLACALGLPILADMIGAGRIVAIWAFPAGLLISASSSVAVIVRAPIAGAGARPVDAADEPHAYARDVAPRRSGGDA